MLTKIIYIQEKNIGYQIIYLEKFRGLIYMSQNLRGYNTFILIKMHIQESSRGQYIPF